MTQTEITPLGTGQPILTLTDAAAKQARKLMDKAESTAIGLRVGIKQQVVPGCSIRLNLQVNKNNSKIRSKIKA